MLRQAWAEADRRGIHWIEFTEADVKALPFEDASVDLIVTCTSRHCFPDPPAALAEMARGLRPGCELRGTSLVKRAGPRQDAFVRLMQLGGVFGPGQTILELETPPGRCRPGEGERLALRGARVLLGSQTRCSPMQRAQRPGEFAELAG
jgi:SAM-dependent methyltransferase